MTASGSDDQLEEAKGKIGLVLLVKDLGDITRYLNIACEYDRVAGRFYLSQPDYIERLLEEYSMLQAYDVATPMLDCDKERWKKDDLPLLDEVGKKRFQALVGSLLYLMHVTGPDIAFVIIRLSQYSAKPRSQYWDGLKRILRYLKGTKNAVLTRGKWVINMLF